MDEKPMRVATLISAVIFLVSANFSASAAPLEQSPRALVHLLDYLATDYGGAVVDGNVVSKSEYEEQVEFADMADEIGNKLRSDKKFEVIANDLRLLKALIESKAQAEKVTAMATAIKNDVIKVSQMALAPMHWPDIKNGGQIFKDQCTTCHGVTGAGDGPAAAALEPKPRNLLDDEHMRSLSAFHIFNVIKLGIPGTAMVAAPDLSEKQTWDLSFYVLSLRQRDPVISNEVFSLEQVASLSDEELAKKFHGNDEERKRYVAALRLKSNDDTGGPLAFARATLSSSLTAYKDGRRDEAKNLAVAAYLEGIEPVEPKLRVSNETLKSELEKVMAEVRSSIEQQLAPADLEQKIHMAQLRISEAEVALMSKPNSFFMTFSMAAGIVFREGFEAILVILAILGVIRGAAARRAARFVHGGWVAALLLGVAAWFCSGWILIVSGAQRELSEGVASLFAVVVLLYMGFWLHSKTEIRRWTKFINEKVQRALEGSSRWGLFALSFIAVFREALESVLFMRAVTLEGDHISEFAMFTGVAFSFAVIFVMAYSFFKFSVKLPVRKLFALSSAIMVGLSIILVGKGLHSLQEVGLLSITSISLPVEFPLVGVFSTFETVMAQVATILGCFAVWIFMGRATPAVSRNDS
jgi:high-affinity iron transporter